MSESNPSSNGHGKAASVNLDRLTVPELAALRDAAEAKRLEKLDEARTALLNEFREKASGLGLSLEAMVAAGQRTGPAKHSGKARRGTGEKVAVKFRGPNGEEWSGRGREPAWIKGKNREEFAVG